MRITKQIAETIVNKLIVKLTGRDKEIEKEMGVILIEESNKTIPKEILDLYEKHPKYFSTTSGGYLYFLGRSVYVYTNTSFLKNRDNIKVTDPKIASRLELLENERIDLKKQIKSISKELLETIIKLGTTNKIIEHLPEAIPFLPEESIVPAINLTDTRNKLKEIL